MVFTPAQPMVKRFAGVGQGCHFLLQSVLVREKLLLVLNVMSTQQLGLSNEFIQIADVLAQ